MRRRAAHRPAAPPRPDAEAGFTLVELLVSVAIMGVVVGAIGVLLVTLLRAGSSTTDRLANSQSEQLLTKYFAADVQQAAAVGTGALDPGCATYPSPGVATSENVVRFSTVHPGGTTSYVSYRTYLTPSSERQLVRVACVENGQADVVVAAHDLRAVAPAAVSVGLPDRPLDVLLELHLEQPLGGEPFSFTVRGSRTPTGSTLAPPSTVAHQPPASDPCTAQLQLDPSSVGLVGTSLDKAVDVTATLSGLCPVDWSVAYEPDGATPVVLDLAGSGSTRTGEIPSGGATWTETGPAGRLVRLVPRGSTTAVADAPLVVTAASPPPASSACVLTNPNPAFGGSPKLSGNVLDQDIRLVMQPTTNPHDCHDLAIRFKTKDGKEQIISVEDEGQNVTATIPKGFGPFQKGTKYVVTIIDRAAADAVVGHSEFTTWK